MILAVLNSIVLYLVAFFIRYLHRQNIEVDECAAICKIPFILASLKIIIRWHLGIVILGLKKCHIQICWLIPFNCQSRYFFQFVNHWFHITFLKCMCF